MKSEEKNDDELRPYHEEGLKFICKIYFKMMYIFLFCSFFLYLFIDNAPVGLFCIFIIITIVTVGAVIALLAIFSSGAARIAVCFLLFVD